jgi:hypothetical protein
MLMDVPYPYSSGFSDIKTNVGKLQNRGIDITVDYDILRNKNYYLKVFGAFNYNAGKVLELFQGREQWTVANTMVSYVVGKPVCFYLPLFAGVDPADGAPVWYLANETDNSITTRDPNRTTKTFDDASLEQNSGKLLSPPVNGGFGIEAGYRGFYFSSQFSFSLGKYLINNDRYFSSNPSNFPGYNQHREVLDYWKKPGDVAAFPAFGHAMQFDDHLLDNASFMRLKALTVGYSLPESLLKKQKIFKAAKVYLVGRNLLTWTKYKGTDPEIDSNLTYGAYPNTKEFGFGAEFTF